MDILGASLADYDPSLACDIVAKFVSGQFIERIAQGYDNIIIDTPPVLVGPDALLWSKAAKSVIMVSDRDYVIKVDLL
jgi:cellulose biosynthesis protein BcsQ